MRPLYFILGLLIAVALCVGCGDAKPETEATVNRLGNAAAGYIEAATEVLGE